MCVCLVLVVFEQRGFSSVLQWLAFELLRVTALI